MITNSEGLVITYTNGLLETSLLQLNSSNNYYTSGEHYIVFIRIVSNKILNLDYSYVINRNIFSKLYNKRNTVNDCSVEFILNNTSTEYTLQGVCNASSYLSTITSLQQVFLAIYGTDIFLFPCTCSEILTLHIIKYHKSFPITINSEIVLNPRAYDHAVFEMISGNGKVFSAKHNPWRTTNSTISFINESMYMSWRLSNSKYV